MYIAVQQILPESAIGHHPIDRLISSAHQRMSTLIGLLEPTRTIWRFCRAVSNLVCKGRINFYFIQQGTACIISKRLLSLHL